MGSDYFNKERYYDPTAGAAISHVKKEERRKHQKSEKHKESHTKNDSTTNKRGARHPGILPDARRADEKDHRT